MRTGSWTPKRPTSRPHPILAFVMIMVWAIVNSLRGVEYRPEHHWIHLRIYVDHLLSLVYATAIDKNRPDYRDCLHSAVARMERFV